MDQIQTFIIVSAAVYIATSIGKSNKILNRIHNDVSMMSSMFDMTLRHNQEIIDLLANQSANDSLSGNIDDIKRLTEDIKGLIGPSFSMYDQDRKTSIIERLTQIRDEISSIGQNSSDAYTSELRSIDRNVEDIAANMQRSTDQA